MDILSLVQFSHAMVAIVLATHFKFLVATALIATAVCFFIKAKPVYLIDFMCYRPPDTTRVPISAFIEYNERLGKFSEESIDFQTRVIERSGIGNETYLPTGFLLFPNNQTLNSAMDEVEMVLFSVVQNFFQKHKINPRTIDILITNCSVVSPTPSLASMIINKFGFRSNVMSFNLSGMGCSAGILSISLAQDLLKVHKNSWALILSMESICSNAYHGKVKSMLLANCLFKMGGAAVLLSNRKRDRKTAKYELKHLVRTHIGANDGFYNCVVQEQDDEGFTGVSLSRSIQQVAGEALKTNIRILAVLVLPYSEQIKYGLSVLWKKIYPPARKNGSEVPDFRKAFEHFCIHAGGKSVIEMIKEKLKLKDEDVEASKMTLHRFGNTSSSSTWYSLSYLEAKGRVKKRDRIWQLAFGSGFKCASAVWKCISEINPRSSNAWSDRIHQYPVEVPDVIDH
ncbi:3-ketoacyl-CoA synthase 7 [Ziziphus jujuba]|uniref:3-ketoacyl-CoA synthase n=1 Tax=Ziziphus jujuba TaxID=326968 RepID=A0ABM3ZT70_ZIZJJ|nr:3-ketoacyl-CoA synthase 7 [Ziziphus jujuba]